MQNFLSQGFYLNVAWDKTKACGGVSELETPWHPGLGEQHSYLKVFGLFWVFFQNYMFPL